MIEGLLLRLLIAFFVYWLGEKIVALFGNAELRQILMIVLLLLVVLYVLFGSAVFL